MVHSYSTPDIYISCPLDGKILDYYAGKFDTAYVSLSPFIEAVSISPNIFYPDTYPNRETILRTCQPVTWRKVMELSKLSSLAAVDIGLSSRYNRLLKEYAKKEDAARLDSLADSHSILCPIEGWHSDFLHNQVLSLFQELGHREVWVDDGHSSGWKLHSVDSLKNEKERVICYESVLATDHPCFGQSRGAFIILYSVPRVTS